MDLDLKNKIVVVTGGAKGIGKAIVLALADEEAIPFIVGRNEDDNQKLVEELKLKGRKAYQVKAELSNADECRKAINKVLESCTQIDGLVNNAGINDGVGLEHGNYDQFMASLHKNLVHYYLITHFALPSLKISKGSILNITSKTAETGQGGTSGYAAANGGRNALTREWAVELLKYQIRVNAIVVSESWTPLYKKWLNTQSEPDKKLVEINKRIPLENRMTKPEEIAAMAVFILSSQSSHTTGQLIHVDGGYVHLDRAIGS
jgi:L-fucose dehydrogenase